MSSRIRSKKPSEYITISASDAHKNKTVPASKQYRSIESVYASHHLLVNSHHGCPVLFALIIYINEKQEPEHPHSCSNIYYMPPRAQTQVPMKHGCLIFIYLLLLTLPKWDVQVTGMIFQTRSNTAIVSKQISRCFSISYRFYKLFLPKTLQFSYSSPVTHWCSFFTISDNFCYNITPPCTIVYCLNVVKMIQYSYTCGRKGWPPV